MSYLAIPALVCLAGCAGSPPPEPQHRCVTIPNGLVECHEVTPAAR
jgi:hypothetical protein